MGVLAVLLVVALVAAVVAVGYGASDGQGRRRPRQGPAGVGTGSGGSLLNSEMDTATAYYIADAATSLIEGASVGPGCDHSPGDGGGATDSDLGDCSADFDSGSGSSDSGSSDCGSSDSGDSGSSDSD